MGDQQDTEGKSIKQKTDSHFSQQKANKAKWENNLNQTKQEFKK